nr:MAG TPA: hypothetical protein [Bacteriophage sp.]
MNLTNFEKAVLEKAYKNGLRFLVRANGKDIMFLQQNPAQKNLVELQDIIDSLENIIEKVEVVSDFGEFKFAKLEEILSIENILGIIDWSKVKKDTLVKVRSANGVQHFRYFCRKIDNVHGIEVYPFGTTSVTAPNEDTEVYYDFELVEK